MKLEAAVLIYIRSLAAGFGVRVFASMHCTAFL